MYRERVLRRVSDASMARLSESSQRRARLAVKRVTSAVVPLQEGKARKAEGLIKGPGGKMGVWRKIRGANVFISDGKITSGPDHLVGKSLGQAKGSVVKPDDSDKYEPRPKVPGARRPPIRTAIGRTGAAYRGVATRRERAADIARLDELQRTLPQVGGHSRAARMRDEIAVLQRKLGINQAGDEGLLLDAMEKKDDPYLKNSMTRSGASRLYLMATSHNFHDLAERIAKLHGLDRAALETGGRASDADPPRRNPNFPSGVPFKRRSGRFGRGGT